MPAQKRIDDKQMMKLYMQGKLDKEIAKEAGCSKALVCEWRKKNGLETNTHIFDWQRELRPSEFAKIPEKYWNPRFKRVSA